MICETPSCTNQARRDGLCHAHLHERKAEETCECPPGWRHKPSCSLVGGKAA